MAFLLFGLIKAIAGESKNENVQDKLRYLLGRASFNKKYISELDSIFPFIGEFDAQDFAYELSRTSFELFSYFVKKLIESGSDIKFIEEIFFIIDKGGYPQNNKQRKLEFLKSVYRRMIKEELTKIEDNQHRIIPELAEEILDYYEE